MEEFPEIEQTTADYIDGLLINRSTIIDAGNQTIRDGLVDNLQSANGISKFESRAFNVNGIPVHNELADAAAGVFHRKDPEHMLENIRAIANQIRLASDNNIAKGNILVSTIPSNNKTTHDNEIEETVEIVKQNVNGKSFTNRTLAVEGLESLLKTNEVQDSLPLPVNPNTTDFKNNEDINTISNTALNDPVGIKEGIFNRLGIFEANSSVGLGSSAIGGLNDNVSVIPLSDFVDTVKGDLVGFFNGPIRGKVDVIGEKIDLRTDSKISTDENDINLSLIHI